MSDWVLLGRIRRARGLRGEVVVDAVSRAERFVPGLRVHLMEPGASEGRVAAISASWVHDGQLVLGFQGVDNRTDAETLRGLEINIPLEERPPAPDGEYYFSDLIGCRVVTVDGRELGEVRAWHEYGAAPLLEVRLGERELLIPFTAGVYREVDLAGRRIVVELPQGLEELNG